MAEIQYQDMPDAQKQFIERIGDDIADDLEAKRDEVCKKLGVSREVFDAHVEMWRHKEWPEIIE